MLLVTIATKQPLFRDRHLYPAKIVFYSFPSKISCFFVTANPSVGLGRMDHHVPPPKHMELPAAYRHELPKRRHKHNPQTSSYLQTLPNVFVVSRRSWND